MIEKIGYEWGPLPEFKTKGLIQIVFIKEGKVVCHEPAESGINTDVGDVDE